MFLLNVPVSGLLSKIVKLRRPLFALAAHPKMRYIRKV
jgi:hypothetical protein